MAGGHATRGTVLNGHSIRKIEIYCLRRSLASMDFPRSEGMKEVKDIFEAGFLFSDTICNYADIDT